MQPEKNSVEPADFAAIDAALKRAAKIAHRKYAFEELFLSKLIDRMDQNQEIFEKILEDKAFGSLVREWMMKKVYGRLNETVG